MADLRARILSARKPVDASPGASTCDAGRIAPEGNSSFGILSKTPQGLLNTRHPVQEAHVWADTALRASAPRRERVILAVRDAARQAESKGLKPQVDEIYVASSIRQAWNLSAVQLSKGLKDLDDRGEIRFTCQKRGRHARFTLLSISSR
jgi:hypothetical protein